MKELVKKASVLGISVLSVLEMGAFAVALASTKPDITDIKDKTDSSVTLEVKDEDYKDTKVKIQIRETNRDKHTKKNVEKTVKLDSDGEADVKLTKLKADTKYSFKIRMKKKNGSGSYSDWSDSEEANTDK